MDDKLKKILGHFALAPGALTVAPYGNGHINDTYLVTTDASPERYIFQRLNRYVFKRPLEVIENIEKVTEHLKRKIIARGGDPLRETLMLIKTHDGQPCFVDETGDCYRVYRFIEHTVFFDLPDSPQLFERAGYSFGLFQRQLLDFPAAELHETIVNFHNTPERFKQFKAALDADAVGRAREAGPEIAFVLAREADTRALTDAHARGELPLRVTHNDTKLNNILMDRATGEGVCVIDLDTVMPGLAAYDFGDSIRTGASTAAEDEPDLSAVSMSLTMYSAYSRGYLRALDGSLSPAERMSLPMGAKLMTFECGVRFLADYLNGDVYFKVHKPAHNLIRARNQFKLVKSMEDQWQEMHDVIGAVGEQ